MPTSPKVDEQAAKRKAAQQAKKVKLARKQKRKSRGSNVVNFSLSHLAGTKVTVTVVVEDSAKKPEPTPKPEEVISDVKREVLRFENSRYAMAYGRPRTPWASAARRGCRRI